MKTQQSKILVELVSVVLSVCAIYMAIWLTGFHDTARRWTLLVSLFGIWLSFYIGRSFASRAAKTNTGEGVVAIEQPRTNSAWGVACMIVLMLAVGLILRLTA